MRLYPKAAKCSDPDCALLLFRNINGRTLTDEELLTILGGGKTPYLKFVSRKSGKPYMAALSLDEEYALKFEFQEKEETNKMSN
ncbi:topoisomerase C-terminal repeat-containing protein [Alistipes indistinctus]|uniref:topoisomerase C-terminal repeat-containing protein n=1 Tax=Alistipes indistinctus TaxID=626932 RepID=UPI0032C0C9E8